MNHQKIIRASSKSPCLTCGSKKWPCSYVSDRSLSFCCKVTSERQARDGVTWMHFNDTLKVAVTPKPIATKPPVSRASPDHLHAVYSALLSLLILSLKHKAALMARGLPLPEIEALGFKSVPTEDEGKRIARELSSMGLMGVPGFYRSGKEWKMVSCLPGFFVPYRDEQGSIEGLQIRRWPYAGDGKYIWLSSKDKPLGASSGAPLNFSRVELLPRAREVLITEGGLKSQIISCFTQAPVIAAASVSTFGADFGARLRALFPALRCAVIAFDKDALEKPEVNHALMSLTAQLERARFAVRIRTWPTPDKGYDDYLLSQLRLQGREAAA